jgi:hypothetical protein
VVTVEAVVAVAAFPVILAIIGLVTVKFVKIPTLVKLEFKTVVLSVVPVKVDASAVTVMSALPSKATPLMFFVAASLVAVVAEEILPSMVLVNICVPVKVCPALVTARFASKLGMDP